MIKDFLQNSLEGDKQNINENPQDEFDAYIEAPVIHDRNIDLLNWWMVR